MVYVVNELLKTMSDDMGITCYKNEPEESYIYRLCYSALGQWCLSTAKNSIGSTIGTTKQNQSLVISDLLIRLIELFPCLVDKFNDANNQRADFPVNLRRLYEETGYLLTDNDNRNRIAHFGRTILIGGNGLFFGLPSKIAEVNGLGMYASPTGYTIQLKDFLLRDNLSSKEYFYARFDGIDFLEREIDLNELEFFNPKTNLAPSKSWVRSLKTDCTIARRTEMGPYFRIMRFDNAFQFADEHIEQQKDRFVSYEYRRLYFALKSHYGFPIKASIQRIDDIYSRIRLGGHLPNREYFLLLLLSWPENNAYDKTNFIIRNNILPQVLEVLTNIGIEIKEIRANG